MTPLLAALLLAAPPPTDVLKSLHQTVRFSGVTMSQDGKRIAWVEQVQTPDGPSWDESILHVRDDSGAIKRVTAAGDGKPCDEGEADFSPDGKSLAFLSDTARRRQPQLYLANLETGAVRQLTHANGHLAHPRFSPDGKTLAVLFMENSLDALGPLRAAARQTGVVGEKPVEQRIALVQVEGAPGELLQVSPPDLFVYEYGWRPDGQAVVATAAAGSGDDNWWIAKLYLFGSGREPQLLYAPRLQICEPAFSPDGKSIAFIEGLMSDQGSNGGDLFVLPTQGGKPRNLTLGYRGSPATLRWLDAKSLLVGTQLEGDSAFVRVAADGPADQTDKPQVLWRGPVNLTVNRVIGLALSSGGKSSAAVQESFASAPEVVAGPIGRWKPITQRNAKVSSPAGEAKSLTWKSDPFQVQGWLLAPREKPRGKAPLVVLVHGGPAAAVRPSFSETALLLASQGYYVLEPNPRGSFGQGEAFTEANVKDFGYGDLRDILAGVDAAVAAAPIDPERVGIYGHSYGGYLTMWAVTQTNRFRAAVASAGLANWQSYYGENLIDQWMLPYFGKSVYEDPEIYRRSSPIEFVHRVRTPTLVLHGERDAEVPLPQGQEFWHALKALGVETQFVVYADEGHRIRKPQNVRDHAERLVGWFDKHLKDSTPAPNQ
jgi:dipeptidyl aminopeptidase/acylaminoacyl peptidase